jgi:hypothetical protein
MTPKRTPKTIATSAISIVTTVPSKIAHNWVSFNTLVFFPSSNI